MHHRSLSIVSLALAVPLVAASVQVASASPLLQARPAPVGTGAHSPPAKMPALSPLAGVKGYQQVYSDLFTDGAGQQAGGSVTCPAGTQAVGGGAVISGTSLTENLNGSYPRDDGVTWAVFVNNAGTVDGTFRVFADCAKKVLGYSVVLGSSVENPAGSHDLALAFCPSGTAPLGGGGSASSNSTAVSLNSSAPLKKGWRAYVNNTSTGDNFIAAYVICGTKPTSYVQVTGTPSTVDGGSQGVASVACPSGTVVYGGGGLASSGSSLIELNSSAPLSTGWIAYENNNDTTSNLFEAFAICGKAKATT